MTKQLAGDEPSMDEILASIRKIIAEDGGKDAGAPIVPQRPERSSLAALPMTASHMDRSSALEQKPVQSPREDADGASLSSRLSNAFGYVPGSDQRPVGTSAARPTRSAVRSAIDDDLGDLLADHPSSPPASASAPATAQPANGGFTERTTPRPRPVDFGALVPGASLTNPSWSVKPSSISPSPVGDKPTPAALSPFSQPSMSAASSVATPTVRAPSGPVVIAAMPVVTPAAPLPQGFAPPAPTPNEQRSAQEGVAPASIPEAPRSAPEVSRPAPVVIAATQPTQPVVIASPSAASIASTPVTPTDRVSVVTAMVSPSSPPVAPPTDEPVTGLISEWRAALGQGMPQTPTAPVTAPISVAAMPERVRSAEPVLQPAPSAPLVSTVPSPTRPPADTQPPTQPPSVVPTVVVSPEPQAAIPEPTTLTLALTTAQPSRAADAAPADSLPDTVRERLAEDASAAAAASALGSLAAGLAAASRPSSPEIVVSSVEVTRLPSDERLQPSPATALTQRSTIGGADTVTSVFTTPSAFVGGVALTPVKSLDDTAAELLRPMLRQWLDSNMPRIVEKALRIEIAGRPELLPPPKDETSSKS